MVPSLEEAREQAFTYGDGVCFLCRWEGESVGVPGPYNKATEAGPFCERHNAGGQYDEQHIAALVGLWRRFGIRLFYSQSKMVRDARVEFHDLMNALAGQTEDVSD